MSSYISIALAISSFVALLNSSDANAASVQKVMLPSGFVPRDKAFPGSHKSSNMPGWYQDQETGQNQLVLNVRIYTDIVQPDDTPRIYSSAVLVPPDRPQDSRILIDKFYPLQLSGFSRELFFVSDYEVLLEKYSFEVTAIENKNSYLSGFFWDFVEGDKGYFGRTRAASFGLKSGTYRYLPEFRGWYTSPELVFPSNSTPSVVLTNEPIKNERYPPVILNPATDEPSLLYFKPGEEGRGALELTFDHTNMPGVPKYLTSHYLSKKNNTFLMNIGFFDRSNQAFSNFSAYSCHHPDIFPAKCPQYSASSYMMTCAKPENNGDENYIGIRLKGESADIMMDGEIKHHIEKPSVIFRPDDFSGAYMPWLNGNCSLAVEESQHCLFMLKDDLSDFTCIDDQILFSWLKHPGLPTTGCTLGVPRDTGHSVIIPCLAAIEGMKSHDLYTIELSRPEEQAFKKYVFSLSNNELSKNIRSTSGKQRYAPASELKK